MWRWKGGGGGRRVACTDSSSLESIVVYKGYFEAAKYVTYALYSQIKKVGKAGNRTITVNNESGTAVLTIARPWGTWKAANDPTSVESIIIYKW